MGRQSITMVSRIFIVFILLILAIHISKSVEADNRSFTGDIRNLAESQFRDIYLPGLAVGVVKNNEIIYAEGFGQNGTINSDTPFIIGSLSKIYTATAIMQLIERGSLNLDDPINKYIPDFYISGYDSSKITVRHLLNHTSGISTLSGEDSYGENTSLEDAVSLLKTHKLNRESGTKFEYSNANYRILGLLIERVTGKSYGEYIEGNIFKPLNSRCSYTSYETAKQNGLVSGYKTAFGLHIKVDEPYIKAALPSGFLISCVDDINKFILANLRKDPALLMPESYEKLHSESKEISSNRSYGLGWHTNQINGSEIYKHSGDTITYHALIVLLPERQSGFIVLTNTNSLLQGSAVDDRIGNNLINLLSDREVTTGGINFLYLYVFASIALAVILGLLAFRIRSLFKEWGLKESQKKLFVSISIDFVIGLLLLFLVPKMIGSNVTILRMFNSQPDLTLLLIAGIASTLMVGIIRLVILLRVYFLRR
jgi:CubicO group peptidase (beta-lactamase class C family)